MVPIRGRSGGAGAAAAKSSGGSSRSANAGTGRPSRSGIGEARRYSPRGRTVRDSGTRDPFRPALELLQVEPAPKTPRKKAAAPRQRAAPPPVRTTRGRPAKAAARRPARKPKRVPRLAEPARRLRAATVIVLVMFTIVAGRLVALQLTDAGQIARQGLHDRLASEVLFAPRGAILDRSGHVLAQSVAARYVYADPSLVPANDVEPVAEALRAQLGIPTSELIPKLSRKKRADGSKDQFEYLARGVDIQTGNAITTLNLPGIGVGRDERHHGQPAARPGREPEHRGDRLGLRAAPLRRRWPDLPPAAVRAERERLPLGAQLVPLRNAADGLHRARRRQRDPHRRRGPELLGPYRRAGDAIYFIGK